MTSATTASDEHDPEIDATRREVDTRDVNRTPAHVVRLTRIYDTGVDDLWSACTEAQRIPRWLLPISGELRLGGRYQLEGNAGGTIERCEPPTHLAASWEYGGSISRVDLTLTPLSPEATELVLEHISHVDDDDKWAIFGPGAVGVGWDLIVRALALHLVAGAAADHDRARTWSTSTESSRFVSLSARSWMTADIDAGADPDLARAAAERTTAFYTGAAPAPATS